MTIKQTDLDYAYKYCEHVSKKHYENFPVGSLLIPKDKRKYIYSIYAFARFADDIADSVDYKVEDKLYKLKKFGEELDKIDIENLDSLDSDTRNIFIALYNTVKVLQIPVQELKNLLIAFKQDAVEHRYNNFEELLGYSKFSANPVGHLVLYIFGYTSEVDEKCFAYSDKICSALQLTNFWQDVSLDLKVNRVYVPLQIMRDFHYDENMLLAGIENDNFRNVIKHLVTRTLVLFEDGSNIINYLSGRLKLEIKATIEGGREILNKIDGINYNVLSQRVTINNLDKLKLLGRIFWK